MITDRIERHEVLLLNNVNHDKICDVLGFFKIKINGVPRIFASRGKKPVKCTRVPARTVLLQCPINAAFRTADSQSDLRIFLQLFFHYTICINRRAMFLFNCSSQNTSSPTDGIVIISRDSSSEEEEKRGREDKTYEKGNKENTYDENDDDDDDDDHDDDGHSDDDDDDDEDDDDDDDETLDDHRDAADDDDDEEEIQVQQVC